MTLLAVLLLALHLLAVNMASAGPLVCVWLLGRGRWGDEAALRVGRRLAVISLAALLVGMGLGAAQLALAWFTSDAGYWNALGRFPAIQYYSAAGELAFSLILLVVYVSTWERSRGRPWLHGLFAVLSATNLLYHFPPWMIVLSELSVRPGLSSEEVITRDVFLGLMRRPEVLAQVVHHVIASVAVAGAAVMWLARRDESAGRLVPAGAAIALGATVLQLGVGLWVLFALPTLARDALIGGDGWAAGLFALSLVAVFGLVYALAGVALGDTRAAAVNRAVLLMLAVVVLMCGALVRARQLEAAVWDVRAGPQAVGFVAREGAWVLK